jgi:hypothetical protein
MIALTRPVARRTLLALPARLFPFLLLRDTAQAAGGTVSLSEFLALSARLTGKTGLDPKVASIYLTALVADPKRRPELADLAHGRHSHADLEREIIRSWYTGTYKSGNQGRVATHRQALMWNTLGVSAPATCGGPMGFWARPSAEIGIK